MKRIAATKLNVVLIGAAVTLSALLCWYLWQQSRGGFGILSIIPMTPPHGYTDSVAISPNGARVAFMGQAFSDGSGSFFVEVRNVASGQQVSKLTIPLATAEQNKMGYSMSPKLSFCDSGKYLVAFAPLDRLYVADTRTSALRDPIHFYDLRIPAEGADPNPSDSPVPEGPVQFDCAASDGVAVLGFSDSVGTAAIKLIDLESGKELADLAGVIQGLISKSLSQRYESDGLAISPDGSKVAVVVWQWGQNEGPTVDLLDTQRRQLIRTLHLGDGFRIEHRLTFAGEGALVIGEPECQPNGKCDPRSLPRGRTLRVWDFAGSGAVTKFAPSGTETYRSVGASANGDVVFAYTGDESYCSSCSSRNGELKIHNARFTVWDRASGKVVARSPKLRVETHSCPWLTLGACESYQQVPEMQMSANGKSILAFWPQRDFPPPEKIKGLGDLEVFNLQ